MTLIAPTVSETVEQLHGALRDYIEATYHITAAPLVEQRHSLLNQATVIHQRPYFESTPRYKKTKRLREIDGIPAAALEMLESVTRPESGALGALPRLIFDPPYRHQADAIHASLALGRSLVVMTGTGSGKTESFLLPILGKLAVEAAKDPRSFNKYSAVRALVLYPMNALVNDQLGRVRLLFGDSRIVARFTKWAGRPARFARYTSRTLYPGVRDAEKDKERLRPLESYYIDLLERGEETAVLVRQLKERGKWPSKPDLRKWFGAKGSRWQKSGEFVRAVTLPYDPELLTRHEVQANPPDILITNYSMLEYMLMRPLERPIFDATQRWLEESSDEKFLLVLDEAHLYRGAAGAEVGMLLRRLRARLGIPRERMQVICTSASFSNPEVAREFGAQLTGTDVESFQVVTGELDLRSPSGHASASDGERLAAVDLGAFYSATDDTARLAAINDFLEFRGVKPTVSAEKTLYTALSEYPPMNLLINVTMKEAWPMEQLERRVFPENSTQIAARATTALMTLGSYARPSDSEPGLLPCRVHAFFRGLPGLWVCLDPECTSTEAKFRGGPCGKLYAQPREMCDCGARVFELYTCRHCGTAYARAHTDNVEDPSYLWSEPGETFHDDGGQAVSLQPLDLLLELPIQTDQTQAADLDLVTGRLNPIKLGRRSRTVFLRKDRSLDADGDGDGGSKPRKPVDPGEFVPCAVCNKRAGYGRSSVQDHQTKGDQPFQALVAKQIQVQPPSPKPPTRLAPNRGRKVLVFSDSRQTAARLAPNLQDYSNKDVLRPLLLLGFHRLCAVPRVRKRLTLDDSFAAALIAAHILGVRLRPELRQSETFAVDATVEKAIKEQGVLEDDEALSDLIDEVRSATAPEALLRGIYKVITDPFLGLEPLALATLRERESHRSKIIQLPAIAAIADTDEKKLALARAWLQMWIRSGDGVWLRGMTEQWANNEVSLHSGKFEAIKRLLGDKSTIAQFEKTWLDTLLMTFTEKMSAGKHRLRGADVSLSLESKWQTCRICRSVQRPLAGRDLCVQCHSLAVDTINPNTDAVFVARKRYYRQSTIDALATPPIAPTALLAAEHTAQIGTAQSDEVYSRAEEHELLFQDVELGPDEKGQDRPALDVLSCTTTMEVGIDIGSLSGVALRNMPPARANYQQRSGRAGRRGNSIATVTALASADSHDEHFFAEPDQLVRGKVDDPKLTLDNYDIARRHVTAYLLQRYHGERLTAAHQDGQPKQLFEVLGTVAAFGKRESPLNRLDFEAWLISESARLRSSVDAWLPSELAPDSRSRILEGLTKDTLEALDSALEIVKSGTSAAEVSP